jgi:hypothetical protein
VRLAVRCDCRSHAYRCPKLPALAAKPRQIPSRLIRIDEFEGLAPIQLRRNFHGGHLAQKRDELTIRQRIARQRLRRAANHQVGDVAIR